MVRSVRLGTKTLRDCLDRANLDRFKIPVKVAAGCVRAIGIDRRRIVGLNRLYQIEGRAG